MLSILAMYVLGISCYYHDSAAAIIKNGKVIAAFEEERFTRIKHDNGFPMNAIKHCLEAAGISKTDVDYVAYYEKPLLKFERILETFIATYPFSIKPFIKTMPEWITEKIKVEYRIKKELGKSVKVYFTPHHLSHAAATFLPSSFKKAAIFTSDGTGEYQTSGLWFGEENKIKPLYEMQFPHSLGLLYSTFTAFLGFKVNNDEYKVMGMAAYGKPKYTEKIHQLLSLRDDGSFELDMEYFSFRESFRMWSDRFEKAFGKPRKSKDPIRNYHKDLAASIQKTAEEIIFKTLNHLYKVTKTDNLCIGGGVGLNALANGRIFENTPFKKVYSLGASGDSGGAIGAALYLSSVKKTRRSKIASLSIGNSYSDDDIVKAIIQAKLKHKAFKSEEELVRKTASLIEGGKIVGWFQRKMEFGPRALGSRSILAAPYPYSMKERVNIIKRREQFRPFAGSVLEEKASEYFKIPSTQGDFPFMNFCFQVRKPDNIPAITHKDNTCRIQTVSKKNGIYYLLLKEFYRKTGIPVILNTSFNLKGEPIVETPEQAIDDFKKTKMDYLVIGNLIVSKH